MPDPGTWGWLAAGAVGGAFMWILKDYIAYLKAQAESWRTVALKGANTAERAARLATGEDG